MTEEELREYVVAENQCAIDDGKEGFDVEAAIKDLLKRKELYEKDHDLTFRLRGWYEPRKVMVNDKVLTVEESLKIHNHADEFNWHYGGSGPGQLALAVCIELFGPDKARAVYMEFKWRVIAPLPEGDFDVTISIKTEGDTIISTLVTNNDNS